MKRSFVQTHCPPRAAMCRDGGNHLWERRPEQKTIGGFLGQRHEDQTCSRCGDARCVLILDPETTP